MEGRESQNGIGMDSRPASGGRITSTVRLHQILQLSPGEFETTRRSTSPCHQGSADRASDSEPTPSRDHRTLHHAAVTHCVEDGAIEDCRARSDEVAREGQQKEFCMVSLNTKNVPIDCHQITVGTLRNSLVHPREVFRPAIRDAANCILVVHNHPSGDPTPSDQDISVTERLEQTADVVGIPVIDHIVVGADKAISIQEWRSGNRW